MSVKNANSQQNLQGGSSQKMVQRFDISNFLPQKKASGNLAGFVYCSEHSSKFLSIDLIHNKLAEREYTIFINDPEFTGKLQIGLAPGFGEIKIDTKGPVNAQIKIFRNGTLKIGKKTTINSAKIISDNSDIIIGEDNLWSDEIILQSSDQHGLYDMKTKQMFRCDRTNFRTSDHVWIGRRTLLMPNVEVGYGSVVGAGSVLTRSIGNFCIAAGNPAKIIRRDASWSRSPDGFTSDESSAVFSKFDLAGQDDPKFPQIK